MLITIVCEYCGKSVEYEKHGRARRICFEVACRREYIADLNFNSWALLDVPKEHMRRRDIFQRDGYLCYLCGEPTEPALSPPEALAPVVEHVHSIRSGHTMANCRTAHALCNARKSYHYYDDTLGALVVAADSRIMAGGVTLSIPSVVGERTRCPQCGENVLRSPSGALSVMAYTHGTLPSPCIS